MRKVIIIFLIVLVIAIMGFVGFYFYSMTPVSNDDNTIIYTLNSGTSKLNMTDELKKQGLIKSSFALKIYLFFHTDLKLQAGTYELKKNMSPEEILNKLHNGDIKNDSHTITLVEGRRLTEYVKNIAENLEVTEEDLLSKMSDPEYLQELIQKYWFLDESILNQELYYPLEGYLFPDTYTFLEKSTPSEIIEKILNHTSEKLENLKDAITQNGYKIHDIMSMAAIIELEAVSENDRKTVSQVIYKRLQEGMSLGMDVTTYYAVKKEMGTGLTRTDLNTINSYNTHSSNHSMYGKLPVGPICNPSLMSIEAVLNPSETDYLYFYADVKTGIVYFTRTLEEHNQIQREVG